VFDLSIPKLLVLAVIALVIFGPNELPKIASQAGRALRDLRRIAEGAKNDLREGLGPEFGDFEIQDLSPKRFVHKHLVETLAADQEAQQQPVRHAAANGIGERRRPQPPYQGYGAPGPYDQPGSGPVTAEQILAERFARGEIGEDEFWQRMTTLRAGRPDDHSAAAR
jgi:sec-independent protein translocase protein TatB